MVGDRPYLPQSDEQLLAQCDVHRHRASGPGGQHRNKVSSAIRLRHHPTDVSATASDSRSQHENLRLAVHRLRMNLATSLRVPCPADAPLPPILAECLCSARQDARAGRKRLQIGRKDARFWHVAAILLDLLDAEEAQLSRAAGRIGIGTSNFASVLRSDRHLLAAAQRLRKNHARPPIT